MSDLIPGPGHARPSCVAVVICNEIIEDKRTNSKTLVSLFNQINAAHLPSVHPRLFILASLSDGEGEWNVTVSIRSPSGSEIFNAGGPIRIPDPSAVIDLVVEVIGLPLSEEGLHFVDVIVDGALVAGRRFNVVRVGPAPLAA